MGVTAQVVEREGCYYLNVEGGKVFKTAEAWEEQVGRNFVDFISVFVPKIFMDMDRTVLNKTQVEFRIGTVFDMMLRIKEYGDS
jgi:hypothetical protein